MLNNNVVAEILHTVVKEQGEDYIYVDPNGETGPSATCAYSTRDGGPSCIVGHVLLALDPDAFSLIHHTEHIEFGGINSFGAVTALGYLTKEDVTTEAEYALALAQKVQDAGHPWGLAQKVFDAALAHPELPGDVTYYDVPEVLEVLGVTE